VAKTPSSLDWFVFSHKMEWPQYIDGLKWDNTFARQIGIEAIPSMWLIDQKGNRRHINARAEPGGKDFGFASAS